MRIFARSLTLVVLAVLVAAGKPAVAGTAAATSADTGATRLIRPRAIAP